MRSPFLAAVALLTLTSPLLADGPPWVPLGPGGGVVRSLAVHPTEPNVLYAVAGTRLYKSVNTGFSWSESKGLGEVVQVALDPSRPTTVYALTPSHLFKSVNGGATWAATASAGLPAIHRRIALAIDPSNPSRLFLVSPPGGVWRSGDGGQTWRLASRGLGTDSGNAVTALAVARGTVFAGTLSGLYKTTNAGGSWARLGGLPASAVRAVAASASDPRYVYASLESGLYRSRDGGASWAQTTGPVQHVLFLAVHPRFPRTVFAGEQGLFRSRDFGRTWTTLRPRTIVWSLAIHPRPSAADILYLGAGPRDLETGGVLVSTDDGARWTVRNRGLYELATTAVATDAGGALLAGTKGQGMFRVANPNGPLWSRTNVPAGLSTAGIANAGPGIFFALTDDGSLWRTTSAGASWAPAPVFGPFQMAADPAAAGTVYALSLQRLARTTDAGASWTDLSRPPLDCFVGDLAVAPSSPPGARVLYAAGGGPGGPPASPCGTFSVLQVVPRVFRSSDGGASWVDASAGLEGQLAGPLAVDPLDANVVYAASGVFNSVGTSGIWKSVNGGATWTRLGAPSSNRVTDLVASPVPGRVYAAFSPLTGIFRSDDGGATWRRWDEGIDAVEILDLEIDPSDPGRLYAATDRGVWVLEEID
ncbi:MAG TPA: hypothetical protein VF789_13905 [Thermoanaerobaculia bacterium]